MTRSTDFRLAATTTLTLALTLLVSACGETPAADSEPTVQSYTVRGIVRALPDPARQGTDLYVHHEAIPDFVNDRGESVGMDSMAMPFPVADPTVLDGVAVGDRVTMRFEVEWDGSPPLRVVALEPLPADTVLDFETPAPEPSEAPPAETDASQHDAGQHDDGDHADHANHGGSG